MLCTDIYICAWRNSCLEHTMYPTAQVPLFPHFSPSMSPLPTDWPARLAFS